MTETRTVLSLDAVGYVYAATSQAALADVTFSVTQGEIVGVVGQNGSGKTTLTKLFNGLLHPTTGTVHVAGRTTRGAKVQDLARAVGYVFQNPNHQLFARTVRAELAFGPGNLGLPADEVERRVVDAAAYFGLTELLDQHPYRLSFPLRKIAAIASVVAMRPEIVVFDEPTTGQDDRTTRTINELIRELRTGGTTVIVVSHDMPLLAGLVERVLVMRGGALVADADPRTVFSDQDLMATTNLKAPQSTQIALSTSVPRGARIALTPDELAEDVGRLLGQPAEEVTEACR